MPHTYKLSSEQRARLAPLQWQSRLTGGSEDSGQRQSRHSGSSGDFMEYKKLLPGEDIRHLDWKVLARSDKKVVRRFQKNEHSRKHLILDASRSMLAGVEGKRSIDRALLSFAILKQIFSNTGEPVRFYFYPYADSENRLSPPFGDFRSFSSAALSNNSSESMNMPMASIHGLASPGEFFIFSDFLIDEEMLKQQLKRLSRRARQYFFIHIKQVLDPQPGDMREIEKWVDYENDSQLRWDSNSFPIKLYKKMVMEHYRQLSNNLQRSGSYLDLSASKNIFEQCLQQFKPWIRT